MNLEKIMNDLEKKNPGEKEYLQAVREVLESIEEIYNENPHFESANIIERGRLCSPALFHYHPPN